MPFALPRLGGALASGSSWRTVAAAVAVLTLSTTGSEAISAVPMRCAAAVSGEGMGPPRGDGSRRPRSARTMIGRVLQGLPRRAAAFRHCLQLAAALPPTLNPPLRAVFGLLPPPLVLIHVLHSIPPGRCHPSDPIRLCW